MSYDIKIQNRCDHRISWTEVVLELYDSSKVILPYPVASNSSFKIRINNVLVASEDYTITTRNKPILDTPNVESILLFDKKIKFYEPIIEVSYTTQVKYCPKCNGRKIVDDFIYNNRGDIETVKNEDLLFQRFEKMILTNVRSNVFHKWYGTNLVDLIGMKITDRVLLRNRIIGEINSVAEKIKNIQGKIVSSGRKISSRELLDKILNIELRDTDDPSMFIINVVLRTQKGTELEYSQYISLDETIEEVIA